MGFPLASRVTALDRRRLSDSITSFQTLLALDHSWTGMIEGDGRIREAEHKDVVVVGARLLTALDDADENATWLRRFVLREFYGQLHAALLAATENAPRDYREDMLDIANETGDWLDSIAEDGFETFQRGVPRQRTAIVRDLGRVVGGLDADGDLFGNILCAASALLFVGGVVSTIVPPHLHGIPVAKAGLAAFRVYRCDIRNLEDPTEWRIGRRR
jgi:hypothetical protein